ncbi:efflux RND transporter periplasmic adaptor subunit [Clostridium sp.]|uniref:efflux RND transporter periplasmic adaptor subunit n=1 Tax=Clostridium sp. TaxID=1506 RepID=UPI003D6D2B90
MKKKTVIYVLIVISIIIGIFLINKKQKDSRIITIKTSIASVGELKSYISTTATVSSKKSKEYFGLQSKIKKVNVALGDKVKIGDVLVTYETIDLASTVSQAQIQYDNAILQKKDLYNQNDDIESKISDFSNEIATLEKSSNPTDKAKLESIKQQKSALSPLSAEKLKQADNSVKLAELSLNSAKQKLSENKSSIISTSAGVVTTLKAIEGAVGNGMEAVVIVQDIENLKVVAFLGKYDASKVKIGQEVIIKNGDKTFKGNVSFIDPAANKTVGVTGSETTLAVEISILDKTPDLKIDFDVDVDILVGKVASAIKIPSEALKIEKGGKNLVYVVEENVVRERKVTIGSQSDTEVQITKGIKKGEKIILNPSTSILEGTIVKESTN